MEFLMQAFIRKLKNYLFLDFSYHQEVDGSYLFIFKSLPPEVDLKIVSKTIKIYVDDDKKKQSALQYQPVCMPMENGTDRSIKIYFDKETYAKKMNFLDIVFREWSEKHPTGILK